jgi:hypothetical protein
LRRRLYGGEEQERGPSRFLSELPQSIVRTEAAREDFGGAEDEVEGDIDDSAWTWSEDPA